MNACMACVPRLVAGFAATPMSHAHHTLATPLRHPPLPTLQPFLCRYTSDETPMSQYLNIHDGLDARRQDARKDRKEGPRTFVVGPTGAVVGLVGHFQAWSCWGVGQQTSMHCHADALGEEQCVCLEEASLPAAT